MNHLFLYFTIKGEDLDTTEISKKISVNATVFVKGERVLNKFIKNGDNKFQKTNRWVYSLESIKNSNINTLIKRMYKELSPYIKQINQYTTKYASLLDIVIYTNVEKPASKFNITLSKSSINIINALNTRFSLTIWDA